jgi:hypothetical protein
MAMWPGALIFDFLSRWNGNVMVRLSFYAIIFGLVAALLGRADRRSGFETCSSPDSLAACPRAFCFYLADPVGSVHR